MRIITERLKEREVDVTDGIKVRDDRGWVHVLPDAVEPVLHIYAEGAGLDASEALEVEFHSIVVDAVEQELDAGAQIST